MPRSHRRQRGRGKALVRGGLSHSSRDASLVYPPLRRESQNAAMIINMCARTIGNPALSLVDSLSHCTDYCPLLWHTHTHRARALALLRRGRRARTETLSLI